MATKIAVLACVLVLVGCGTEAEAPRASSEASPRAPGVAVSAPVAPEPAATPGGLVVRDEDGDTVRIGPGGQVVEAEDGETGETATVTQANGTTAVEGGRGERVVTDGVVTEAREGRDVATIGRDEVVTDDGEDRVVIRRDGRGVSIGGLQLGR